MRRENMIAQLLRSFSGMGLAGLSRETGIRPSVLAAFQTGKTVPDPEHLEKLAEAANLAVEDAALLLDLADAYRRDDTRKSMEDVQAVRRRLQERIESRTRTAYEQIRALPVPSRPPRPEDREEAEELWSRLDSISPEGRMAAVRLAPELQTWALCERICHESEREVADGRGERAVELARLAREIADRAGGTEEWRNRLRGYAAFHLANALRVSGDPDAAGAALEEAKSWWSAGADPEGLLGEMWVM